MAAPAWLLRLQDEHDELAMRVMNLTIFIGTEEEEKLGEEERRDLWSQLSYMRGYLDVLVRRLRRHAPDALPHEAPAPAGTAPVAWVLG